jgi:hypothetical protein
MRYNNGAMARVQVDGRKIATLGLKGGRQQSWHVHDFGVIVITLAGDGTLKEYRLSQ